MKNTKCLFDESKHSPDGMVSVSQLQSFMSCPKKWEYGYIENLTPRVERTYLTIGKLCHKGMEVALTAQWRGEKRPNTDKAYHEYCQMGLEAIRAEWSEYMRVTNFLDEEVPEQERVLQDALSVFEQAYYELEPWKYEVYSVCRGGKVRPALELHFVVPCAGSKGLHGFIDAILKDKETGLVWCVDYKFRKTLAPDDDEAFNIQNAVYTHACDRMGINIVGTITWQHVNTPAAEPSLNKNGSVSRAKIKTTWPKFKAFCEANGVDPSAYEEEMREKLADIEWCRITREYRNPVYVERIWQDVVIPAARAVKTARDKGIKRRFMYPWNCKMCQYQSLCQAELRDYDAALVRTLEYTQRGRVNPDKAIVDTHSTPVV